MISRGTRCRINKQITVEGRVAFEQGEEVEVEAISPHPQKPHYKYLVSSKRLGKRFLLSDADLAEITQTAQEDQVVAPRVVMRPEAGVVEESYDETPRAARPQAQRLESGKAPVPKGISKTRRPTKSGWRGKWVLVGAVILAVIAGAIIFVFLVTGEQRQKISPGKAPVPSSPSEVQPKYQRNPEGITLEEFRRIKEGMSYDEVVKIIGGPGRVISGYGTPGGADYTIIYGWVGEEKIYGNATVIFQNGRVSDKRQTGL